MNIEQTVSAAVAGLQLGNTFTLDDLLHAIQDRRGRRLRVVELADLDTHDGICAVWFVTDTDDIVLHARSDSTLHRQQFVLHEFAHMILGHCDGDDPPQPGTSRSRGSPSTRSLGELGCRAASRSDPSTGHPEPQTSPRRP